MIAMGAQSHPSSSWDEARERRASLPVDRQKVAAVRALWVAATSLPIPGTIAPARASSRARWMASGTSSGALQAGDEDVDQVAAVGGLEAMLAQEARELPPVEGLAVGADEDFGECPLHAEPARRGEGARELAP